MGFKDLNIKIGGDALEIDMSTLNTTDKSTLIAAINEVKSEVVSGAPQDFTNLQNHFTYVNNADTNNYGLTGFNAPENVYRIDHKTVAVVFRYNNEADPSTVLSHAAVAAVGGLILYDISDESKPVVLDTYKDVDLIGCMSIAIHGDLLYVMSSKKGTFHVLDISDRNNIVKVSTFQYETSTHIDTVAYRCDIHRNGKFLFICGRYEASAAGRVYSIDVSNPFAPSLVTTSATIGYWTYDIKALGDILYVMYYGSTTPNRYATFDINASTGAITNQVDVVQANANGVSNELYDNKFIVCEWNNHVTVYDVDPDTQALSLVLQSTSPDLDDNRISLLEKYDSNILAFAGYTSNQVGLQVYNEDFSVLLGTSYITSVDFDIVQAIRFIGDYLYILNKSGPKNIMIYKFNYNSFAKERDDYR